MIIYDVKCWSCGVTVVYTVSFIDPPNPRELATKRSAMLCATCVPGVKTSVAAHLAPSVADFPHFHLKA